MGFLEIENEQHARSRFFGFMRGVSRRVRRTDDGEEMIGLLNRIGAVAEMIRAPKQTGPRGGGLSFNISPVALQSWKRRFVYQADNAFVFHRDKIDAHQIVMRHVHDAVAGKGRGVEKQKRDKKAGG